MKKETLDRLMQAGPVRPPPSSQAMARAHHWRQGVYRIAGSGVGWSCMRFIRDRQHFGFFGSTYRKSRFCFLPSPSLRHAPQTPLSPGTGWVPAPFFWKAHGTIVEGWHRVNGGALSRICRSECGAGDNQRGSVSLNSGHEMKLVLLLPVLLNVVRVKTTGAVSFIVGAAVASKGCDKCAMFPIVMSVQRGMGVPRIGKG